MLFFIWVLNFSDVRKLLVISILFTHFIGTSIGQTYTVSGYVTDKETRETLIEASVMIKDAKQGVITDNNGFFSITNLKNGDYTFLFSYVGYEKLERTVHVQGKSILLTETSLALIAIKLRDVTIIGMRSDSIGDKEIETSQLKISSNTIKNIPSAHGDVFKAIKYLPGIEATDPFSPLYSVRGGDPSGNLVLLDGVTVYNPYHYATADGLFNIQSIKDIDLLISNLKFQMPLGSWSQCSDVPVPPLVITKIMFHPPASVEYPDADKLEFLGSLVDGRVQAARRDHRLVR